MKLNNKLRAAIGIVGIYYIIGMIFNNMDYMGIVLIHAGITLLLMGLLEQFLDYRDEKYPPKKKKKKVNKELVSPF
jgi:hypothetical protein